MITAFEFSSALRSLPQVDLRAVFSSTHLVVLQGTIQLDGEELISPRCVLCTLTARSNVLLQIPRSRAHESWLRPGADWHRFDDGSLCIDLPQRWRANLNTVSQIYTSAETALYAATYLSHSLRWLLTRHRYAYECGLSSWPNHWPQWGHGVLGAQQYEKLRRAA